MLMPFGKYRGMPLNRVPDAYLTWMMNNREAVPEGFADAIIEEVCRRGDLYVSDDSCIPLIFHVREIIAAGLREVYAQRYLGRHSEASLDQLEGASQHLLAAAERMWGEEAK